MQAVKIGPDLSTAAGIQRRIEQRVEELKEQLPPYDETEEERPEAWVINELRALHKEIEQGIDDMIEDMHRQDQERAREKEIRMHDAGVDRDYLKAKEF
jgi:predicted translin family RNA/ssDNA-binding protein|tara:strand:- start:2486 stop:2782 length:297 start_codon:yes stop_codon:yes gene_type:complete